jgi:non-specific serine/threonine protein kinase
MSHDAGEVLDGRARAAYRHRIEEIREEIEEADVHGDIGRAERARSELEQLTRQLAEAVGIGGRERRAADAAERARLNVTRAIRAVVGRIGLVNPALARHLDSSVVTGRFCCYQPPGDQRIDWRF